jgi:hypothetical protein
VRTRLALTMTALTAIAGCAGPIPKVPPVSPGATVPGYSSPRYRDDKMWLCRPDLPKDECHADLTATAIRPDGSFAVVPHARSVDAAVDCFYVYPTVDLSLVPGNHTDFRDNERIVKTALAQAARFDEACRVFVPYYRQVTIGTYFMEGPELRDRRLKVAFSDVLDAFLHYMGQYNHGRKVVLVGHSQGAEMVARLVSRLFDHDPAMREKLLVAMPIGGHVEVPVGKTKGATFENVPVCTREDETGCVVAYRTYLEDASPEPRDQLPKPGNEIACVNPAAQDGGPSVRRFAGAYFPSDAAPFRKLVHTPFVVLPDFYAGRCINGSNGFRFLGISIAPRRGDARKNLIDFGSFWLDSPAMGLHILDMQFPQQDLIDLIKKKASKSAARVGPSAG